MAYTANITTLPGLTAGADLSSKQYHAVKAASTAGQVISVDATSDLATGILQNDPASGEEAAVAVGGLAKGKAGTSVGWTAGVRVGYNTTGELVPVTIDDNRPIIGTLPLTRENGSIADGQIISVQVLPGALRF